MQTTLTLSDAEVKEAVRQYVEKYAGFRPGVVGLFRTPGEEKGPDTFGAVAHEPTEQASP